MLYQQSEATAAQRRVEVYLVDATDGLTPETGEATGQPQISKIGGAWANTSATLVAIGNGAYYVILTATELNTLGFFAIRYKSAATAEFNEYHQVIPWDPYAVADLGLTNLDAAISSRSDFDEATDPVELLDTGGAAGTSAEELVDDIMDEVLTGATHNVVDSLARRIRDLQEFGIYEGGAIWIDTVNGNPGTTDYESGTVFNPVDTLADANILAASLGISRFRMAPGSSIAFVASQQNQEFLGVGWTLALGGQNIANTSISGAVVSGIGTGVGRQYFINCLMGAVTLPADTHVLVCGISGTQTLGAGDYFYDRCHSGIAGTSAPLWDFTVGGLNTNLNIRNYSGGLDLRNMGQAGTDTASIEGRGQIIVNANCTGGTIAIRGLFELTDNGAATITQTARTPDNFGLSVISASGAIDSDLQLWLGTAPLALASQRVQAVREGFQRNAANSDIEFLMVLTSDHVTPATGLTVTGQRSIDGGAFAGVSGAIAEVGNGIYQFDALAADTNGSIITYRFSSATADDTFITIKTTA